MATIEGLRRVYETNAALADLPWFERGAAGQVLLADDSLGPIADVHTHLALTFGRRTTVDLWREYPRTEHYLDTDHPVDMDLYANQNIPPADRKKMARDLTLGSTGKGGMRRTHTAPNLMREMDELGIAAAVLLPIDFPALSWNAEAYLEVAARAPKLVTLGSVHPHATAAAAKLARQKAAGARGVKVHPAVQTVAADNPRAMELYRHAADLGLPILWHCGPVGIEPRLGRHLSQLKHYWRAIHDNPDTTFVLGHSGALQMGMALKLAQSYPNVYLETASQSLPGVRQLVAEAPPDRLMMGSDWPFYHQAVPLAKILIATEGDPAARRRVLWENAARLFGL